MLTAVFTALGLAMAMRNAHAGDGSRDVYQLTQPPDAYEPNNTSASAPFLIGTAVTSLTFATNASPSSFSDDDWYSVSLNANTTMTMTATSDSGSLLRITGIDANNNAIPPSGTQQQIGTNSVIVIANTSNAAATYRVLVSNQSTSFARYRIDYLTTVSTAGTPVPIPGAATADAYENNNLPSNVVARVPIASFLNVNSTFAETQRPNFFASISATVGAIRADGDVDWYFFYGRTGSKYRLTATAGAGTDPEIFIVDDDTALRMTNNADQSGTIASNDDFQPLDRSARIDFTAPYEGRYWIKVWNKDTSPRSGAAGYNPSYNLAVQEIAASTTLTPAVPTAFPQGIDRFEYNGDWETAALIAENTKYDNLNFVPFQPLSRDVIDNDFFRMPVKQGVPYTCETLDLSRGTDTNLIVFNQNAPENKDANLIAGNNDINDAEKIRGNFASRVSWVANYTGIVYILIGDVSPPRPGEAIARTYSLQCVIGLPVTPTPTVDPRGTPTPRPTFVPPTELPPEPTFTPFPTNRPAQKLIVRPIEGPGSLQVTPTPTVAPRTISLDVQVFNDINRNGLNDAGEGIAGASVRLSDEAGGTPLAQAITDGDGRVRFLIRNNTPVKVSIPMFGYSTLVDSPNATVRLALPPSAILPDRIP
jgi:hypothetical protein